MGSGSYRDENMRDDLTVFSSPELKWVARGRDTFIEKKQKEFNGFQHKPSIVKVRPLSVMIP